VKHGTKYVNSCTSGKKQPMTELIKLLWDGCVIKPKRWSGDTHSDSETGVIDENATDKLMRDAADALFQSEARAGELFEALELVEMTRYTDDYHWTEIMDKVGQQVNNHAEHFKGNTNGQV
jgi:hypothetical protein